VWLSRIWNEWRSALVIVRPETVIAWRRRTIDKSARTDDRKRINAHGSAAVE
jgi:hypothetical protein